MDETFKDEIFGYIEKSVEDQNFFEYKIDMKVISFNLRFGSESESDLIVEAAIVGKDQNEHNLILDLILKISDKSDNKNTIIRKMFRREMHLYAHILKKVNKFLRQKCIRPSNFVEIFPMHYKSLETDLRDILVFSSLFKEGFVANNNLLSATTSQKFCVLKFLAHLHATGLAYQKQCLEEYERTFEKWEPVPKEFYMHPFIVKQINVGLNLVMDMLTEENELVLRDQWKTSIENGVSSVIERVLSDVPAVSVLVHGDVWMGNIMFKYKKNGIDPEKMKFIYWQLAALHSPVLDLAYFLYFTHTEETNQCFEQYVEYYYSEFCSLLIDLGSDPQKLLPFTTLLDHFVKYSIYPLILAMGGIPLIIIEEHSKGESSFLRDYKDFKYEKLSTELKHKIKTKILGILELHYKYFSQ